MEMSASLRSLNDNLILFAPWGRRVSGKQRSRRDSSTTARKRCGPSVPSASLRAGGMTRDLVFCRDGVERRSTPT